MELFFFLLMILNLVCIVSVKINETGPQHILRMLNVHRDICGYCGCCVSVCPEGALELIDAYLSVEENYELRHLRQGLSAWCAGGRA